MSFCAYPECAKFNRCLAKEPVRAFPAPPICYNELELMLQTLLPRLIQQELEKYHQKELTDALSS